MRRILAYSTLGLPPWPLEDLFLLLRQFGYQGAEIALSPEMIARRDDDAFWERAFLAARAAGVAVTCLHLGNPRLHPDPDAPRLVSRDAAERARHLELIQAAYQIAARLECPRVACASGALERGMEPAEAWTLLMSALNEALALRPDACDLLLEHEPEHFIRSTDQIIELYERSEGQVFCNLDVGHLEVAGEPIGASIERLGEIVRNVHLEDIRGRRHKHLLPGEGEIDFAEVARALDAINYAGPITADLYPFAAAPVQALSRAYMAFHPMAAPRG